MFYFLSKALVFLVMPFTIFFLLFLFGLFSKNKKRKNGALIASFFWLYLISNTWLVTKAFQWWELPASNFSDIQKTYDVGIVLSGGLMNPVPVGGDHPIMGPNSDRFTQAFLLYKAGKIKKIFITGISMNSQMLNKTGETRQAAQMLMKWGVPPTDILFEERARNTRENAVNSQKILETQFPNASYLLITTASHMRRSKKCFDKVGMKTDVFPTNSKGYEEDLSLDVLLIPDTRSLADFDALWHEWIGYIMYKIAGYC